MALCLLMSSPADAQSATRDRTWFATVFAGQWFSVNEPSATQRLGSQDAGFQDSYFVSVLLNNVLVSELRTDWPLISPVIDGSSIELEGQVGRHFGLQDQGEVTLALLWRSREIPIPLTKGRFNIGIGEGLSYALARPTYEGAAHDQEPRKFLNYLALEAEFSHPLLPNVSLVPRVHHRSGIFGLIAPRGSGSDFIGLGLRVTLQ
ncbi:hypothetical protein [Falsiroseomonas sp. E2-1-a20]|uniref:hypothetical protein n=1 Tax=Falsiroseomonas sp. E2-1-a20 TaxID=3239300 RepID=UPI003F3DA512